jgi:transcriptional regulator NrdR family protein
MDKVNISLHFGVKFNINSGVENAVESLITYITNYVESDKISLINSPSLYISNLIQSIINDFESISYITFKGLNNYKEDVQSFESEITDINVLEGSFATNDVVPEYLTIDNIIKKTIKTPQVIIDIL